MTFRRLMANLPVANLDRSRRWYAGLTGREPDAAPMAGLLEWRFGAWGFQLYAEPSRAGGGGLVLDTDDLDAVVARLDAASIAHGEPMDVTESRALVLADPDGNRVVVTAPFAR